MNDISNIELQDLVAQAKWVNTTFVNPHQYVVDDKFPELCGVIALRLKTKGYDKPFTCYGRTKIYRYYNFYGYTYWIVGNCLNRVECDHEGEF